VRSGTSGRAFAATWRDERGETAGTTYGGTMCWFPVKPWRIKIVRDGYEHIVRCRECPGCLEFERRRLAERLHAKYSNAGHGAPLKPAPRVHASARGFSNGVPTLFVVRIWAPIEKHAALCHALHRRRGFQLEPGMYRLGASSFALLSRERATLPRVLRTANVRFRIEPVRLSRGRRAWRSLTAGLIVTREIYGEQTKRFYSRGLPILARDKWEVVKIAKYQGYDRFGSPRGKSYRKLVLVPPEVWKLRRTDRRALRGLLCRQSDPEGVRKVMGLVADACRSAGRAFLVSAPAKPVLEKDQIVAWYRRIAESAGARTFAPTPTPIITPSSGEGGYVSSEHEQGELMPMALARARENDSAEARKRRAIKDSMEIIERMRLRTPK